MWEMLGSLASGLGSLFGGSSAAAGVTSGVASGLANGIVGDFFGRRSRRDSANVSYNSYLKQMAADYAYQNGKGFELAQKYNNANYALARRYAENSASWARRGLEKAGLNPILAASQGFNANMGQQGVSPVSSGASLPSVGGSNPNVGLNMSSAMRDMAGLDVQSSTAAKLKADTNVAQAEADFIKANTAKVMADTDLSKTRSENESKNLGFSGSFAPAGRALQAIGDGAARGASALVDFFKSFSMPSDVNRNYGGTSAVQDGNNAKTIRPAVHDIHTAKELSDMASPSPFPVEKPSPRMLHETRHDIKRSNRRHN